MLQTTPTIERSSPTVIRPRVLVYLVVLGALCAGGVMNASAQSNLILYRQLAVELSEQALELQDDDVARRELARRAADLDPSLADPLVILSRLLQDEQQSQREREAMLRQALFSEFVSIERSAAVTALAELLVQQDRFQEALSLLDAEHIVNGVAPMERLIGFVDRADDPTPAPSRDEDVGRLDRLYMTALLGGDAPWFAGRLMRRLRNQFPLDRELGAMDWRRSTHLSVGVLEWIDAMEQLTGGVSAEMYRELIQADTPSVLIPMLQRRYRQAGGTDPLVAAVAMVHGSDDLPDGDALSTDKLIWELFFQHLDPADLPNELGRALDELREQDRAVLTRDEDRDGFWEERYSFRQGALSLWQHDENQDGRVSTAVGTSGGAITVAVREEEEDAVIVVDFAGYPLVSRVRWVESAGGRAWIPAQPVSFDAGLSGLFTDDLWNALGGRVTVEGDVFERFLRQRRSDTSRSLAHSEAEVLRQELREWGLIQ